MSRLPVSTFPSTHLLVLCSVFIVATASAEQTAEPPKNSDAEKHAEFFDKQVQPILAQHCFKCHGAEAKIKGGLKLTDRESVVNGGESGSVIDDENVLLDAINFEGYEMPPSGKLSDEKIEVLTKWVKLGVPWSKENLDFGFEDEQHAEDGPPQVNEETKQFWSYQPVVRPPTPGVGNKAWVRNSIDGFILSKLEESQLSPNGPASKATLLRRAYYDLTGLPPTLEQVEAFVADDSPDAYENVLDELLASRHYGERWGRHWLDLVRYAESNSFERDGAKPHIWRYRDYVIDSLNDDKPYDQFVREQIAGDEVDEMSPASYIATGYYRLGQWDDEPTDQLQADFDNLDDVVATTGQVFLGMTINCARCHDHKIDPIPQTDYYKMVAFFRGVKPYGHRRLDSANTRMFEVESGKEIDRAVAEKLTQQRQKLERLVRGVENKARKVLSNPEKEDFAFESNRVAMLKKLLERKKEDDEALRFLSAKKIREYEKSLKELTDVRSQDDDLRSASLTAFGVSEFGSEAPKTNVMIRGSAHALGDEVQPGYPSVLSFTDPTVIEPTARATSGRRSVLADWITSPDNPLTARVMMNRLWQHHFGRGIVETPNDFGFQGSRPTHPQLLDWLAHEFMSGSWKLKRMHKLMMLSNTYRMSSVGSDAGLAKDVTNKLFWRMNMRRLSAEEIRDSLLSANGTLNLKAGGPSIYPKIPKSVLAGQSRPGAGWGNSSPEEAARRSVYIHVKRSLVTPILSSFDVADTDFSCPVRFATTQPTQALGMLNSEFLNEQAALLAKRIREEAGKPLKKQVSHALSIATSREPTEDEVKRGIKFIRQLQKQDGASLEVAMNQFCLLVLNLNEFIYLD